MTANDDEEINLTVPSQFQSSDAAELQYRLRPYLNVGAPRYILRKSVDPSLGEQVIQLIGSAAQWAALAGAAAFFGAIGKRAADDLYETIKKALKRSEMTPLAKVSEALAGAAEKAGPGTGIIIGLDIPDSHWGTALLIREPSLEKIALGLARFTSNRDELAALMKAEVEAGRAPLGRAIITFEDDALVVRWRSQKDFTACEIRIPDRGKIGKT